MTPAAKPSSFVRECVLFGALLLTLGYWLKSGNIVPLIITFGIIWIVGPPDDVIRDIKAAHAQPPDHQPSSH